MLPFPGGYTDPLVLLRIFVYIASRVYIIALPIPILEYKQRNDKRKNHRHSE